MPNLHGNGLGRGGGKARRGMGPCRGAMIPNDCFRSGRGDTATCGKGGGVGWGAGLGIRVGWFPVGYGDADSELRAAIFRGRLECRAAILRAELLHTEHLIKEAGNAAGSTAGDQLKPLILVNRHWA